MSVKWEPLTDEDVTSDEATAMTAALQAATEYGAAEVSSVGYKDDGRPVAGVSAALVGGLPVAVALRITPESTSFVWAVGAAQDDADPEEFPFLADTDDPATCSHESVNGGVCGACGARPASSGS